MNQIFQWLVLKALWVILRYVRDVTGNERIITDATITMMQVGKMADNFLEDGSVAFWIKRLS